MWGRTTCPEVCGDGSFGSFDIMRIGFKMMSPEILTENIVTMVRRVGISEILNWNWNKNQYFRQEERMRILQWKQIYMTGKKFFSECETHFVHCFRNRWDMYRWQIWNSRSAEDPMYHLRMSLQNQKARKWVFKWEWSLWYWLTKCA